LSPFPFYSATNDKKKQAFASLKTAFYDWHAGGRGNGELVNGAAGQRFGDFAGGAEIKRL